MLDANAVAWKRVLGTDGSDVLVLCESFERFATATLAPIDFRKLPFYAMPASKLSMAYRVSAKHTGGYYSRCLGPSFKDEHPRWCGDGVGVVVNDLLFDSLRAKKPELADVVFAMQCEAMVHEMAHGLDDLAAGSYATQSHDYGNAVVSLLVLADQRQKIPTCPPTPSALVDDGHGLRFIRTMSHLHHRLHRAGIAIDPDHASCAGDTYGVSPFAAYVAALGNEPQEWRHGAFSEILALPYPQAIVDLWAEDAAREVSAESLSNS